MTFNNSRRGCYLEPCNSHIKKEGVSLWSSSRPSSTDRDRDRLTYKIVIQRPCKRELPRTVNSTGDLTPGYFKAFLPRITPSAKGWKTKSTERRKLTEQTILSERPTYKCWRIAGAMKPVTQIKQIGDQSPTSSPVLFKILLQLSNVLHVSSWSFSVVFLIP